MKTLALMMVFGTLIMLAACESSGAGSAGAGPAGTELGNSGIRASGYVQMGGTLNPR